MVFFVPFPPLFGGLRPVVALYSHCVKPLLLARGWKIYRFIGVIKKKKKEIEKERPPRKSDSYIYIVYDIRQIYLYISKL